MSLTLPSGFGLALSGLTTKFGSGGREKGPLVNPASTSFRTAAVTPAACLRADELLGVNRGGSPLPTPRSAPVRSRRHVSLASCGRTPYCPHRLASKSLLTGLWAIAGPEWGRGLGSGARGSCGVVDCSV